MTTSTLPRPLEASREAFICLGLGLRDAVHIRSVFISTTIWMTAALFWLVMFLTFGTAIRDGVFAVFGMLGQVLLPESWSAWFAAWNGTFVSVLRFISSALLLLALYAVAFIVSVRLVVEFFLIKIIQHRILPSYPSVRNRRPGLNVSLSSAYLFIRNSFVPFVGFSLLFVCLMIIPVINGIALFVLVSYFNVRFLMNDAMDGLANGAELRAYLQTHRLEMLILGVLISLLDFIPLVFLLSPWVLGSSVCHLSMRHLARLEMAPQSP